MATLPTMKELCILIASSEIQVRSGRVIESSRKKKGFGNASARVASRHPAGSDFLVIEHPDSTTNIQHAAGHCIYRHGRSG
jgi:hypothetical protein